MPNNQSAFEALDFDPLLKNYSTIVCQSNSSITPKHSPQDFSVNIQSGSSKEVLAEQFLQNELNQNHKTQTNTPTYTNVAPAKVEVIQGENEEMVD